MTNPLSWNCRGFMNKRDEIRDLISDHRPMCFALQETHLKNTKSQSVATAASEKISILQTEQQVVLLFLFPITFPIIRSL